MLMVAARVSPAVDAETAPAQIDGILTFIASQVVHLPLNAWLADLGILPHAGRAETPPLWQFALVAGLTAGLCVRDGTRAH